MANMLDIRKRAVKDLFWEGKDPSVSEGGSELQDLSGAHPTSRTTLDAPHALERSRRSFTDTQTRARRDREGLTGDNDLDDLTRFGG